VWRAHDQNNEAVRAYVQVLLAELVSERDIVIAET
jgi:hypothetical protein